MFSSIARVVLPALLLSPLGCSSAEPTAPEAPEEERRLDDGHVLEAAEQHSGGKADTPRSCGTDTCESKYCGYNCAAPGVDCVKGCATEDSRPDAFVSFGASGAQSASADSRQHDYLPKVSLQEVLIYGCDLWDFSSGEFDGLEILYREVHEGAFVVGQPSDYGVELSVYAKYFRGPGSYPAELYFSKSSTSRALGKFASEKEACLLEVDSDDSGGVTGKFKCASVPIRAGGTIDVQGEFACGQSALSHPNMIAL